MSEVPKKFEVLNRGGYNINFKGVFHFENLYKLIMDWLLQRGYRYAKNGANPGDENLEDYYFETVHPGGSAKNQWIWWRVCKDDSDIFKYNIEIDFQTLVIGAQEIVVHGDKFKSNNGELTLFIRAWIDFDKSKKWSGNELTEKLFPIAREHDLQDLMDDKILDLHGQVNTLWELVKQYLGLIPMDPMTPYYHPVGGVPQAPINPK